MASLNMVLLIGNLTADPELRYTPQGTAVCNLRLAVNSFYNDKQGQRQQDTCFMNVVVWGKTGENCASYLAKGRQAFVEGRLRSRSWQTEDGQKRSTIEVVANRVQFLGSATGAGKGPQRPQQQQAAGEEPAAGEESARAMGEAEGAPTEDDIPF